MFRKSASVAVVVVSLMSSGCVWAPELARIQREIEAQLPGASFEKDVRVNVGPATLGFARLVTRLIPESHVPEAAEAHAYLEEVRRVQVAVYRAYDVPSLERLHLPGPLEELLEREGWHLAVKTQAHDDLVWVLTRQEDEVIRDVYVITMNTQDLVLVRVSGRMNALLAKAMRHHADEFPDMLGIDVR